MKLREKPLIPWVICETTGKVLCGHCNYMAGLGESCSHIATLLWAIEAGVQVRSSITKKAYWVLPTPVKDVPFASIKDIKFEGSSGALNTWKAVRKRPSNLTLSSSSLSPSPVSSPLLSSPSSLPSTSSDQPGPSFVPSPARASPTLPHLLDHDYFQFPPSPAHSTSSSSSLSGLSSNSSNTCRSSSSKTISPPSEIELNQLFDRPIYSCPVQESFFFVCSIVVRSKLTISFISVI